jgi:epoxyqueuosine reductase
MGIYFMNKEQSTTENFESSPALLLEKFIKDFVRSSTMNRLLAFDHLPVFEEPLIGFADGDDSLFEEYKTIIADFHLTPREALGQHLTDARGIKSPHLNKVSVISYVLPIAKQTRLSNRRQTEGPSLRWNHTRWLGQEFIFELSHQIVSRLEELGHRAVAPELASFFKIHRQPRGMASNWSQRHIAYATGLGTFSLSDGFITPRGIAHRCGSVVTDLRIPPTPRTYPNHLSNCLFYVDKSCRRCIERCPDGAITESGHDKEKCRQILFEHQRPWIEGIHGEGYIGQYAGCGLCQTGVPCESNIPISKHEGRT